MSAPTLPLPPPQSSVLRSVSLVDYPPVTTDLPLGDKLDWQPARRPGRTPLRGSHVLVRPVEPELDAEPLFSVSHPPHGDPTIWTYLPDGPYADPEHCNALDYRGFKD
jgi:hypothetical protein